ncbi:hypothetical protein [Leclercia pneumoniae]|uniref:hypothetical protein n=1 Tax=Leclercia pneumoniae TaxID=2815358 RepID=UPI003AF80E4A
MKYVTRPITSASSYGITFYCFTITRYQRPVMQLCKLSAAASADKQNLSIPQSLNWLNDGVTISRLDDSVSPVMHILADDKRCAIKSIPGNGKPMSQPSVRIVEMKRRFNPSLGEISLNIVT